MKRLVLHIGTQKTGSSSIQAMLKQNRKVLRDHGISIPEMLGDLDHWWLVLFGKEYVGDHPLTRRHGIDREVASLALDKTLEILRQWVSTELSEVVVASSELVSSDLKDAAEVERLGHRLVDVGLDPEVLIYLRDPLEMTVSWWSQQVKAGRVMDTLPSPQMMHRLCDYRQLTQLWESVFPGAVSIRLYDPEFLYGGDVVSDFLQYLGIRDFDKVSMPGRRNKALSLPALQLLSAVNDALGDHALDLPRNHVTAAFRDFGGDIHFVPHPDQVEEFQNYFAESNEWLRRTYFESLSVLWPSAALRFGQPDEISQEETMSRETRKEIAGVIAQLMKL